MGFVSDKMNTTVSFFFSGVESSNLNEITVCSWFRWVVCPRHCWMKFTFVNSVQNPVGDVL
jgi:hypothetical protein